MDSIYIMICVLVIALVLVLCLLHCTRRPSQPVIPTETYPVVRSSTRQIIPETIIGVLTTSSKHREGSV
jgi:hypothetical protein